MRICVAGVTLLHVMEPGQQTGFRMALGRCATGGGGHKGGVINIMNQRFLLVGMAVQAAGRVGSGGDDIGDGNAGWEIRVDVAGRLVTGGAGPGAIRGDIMQGLDVVHIRQWSMTEIT